MKCISDYYFCFLTVSSLQLNVKLLQITSGPAAARGVFSVVVVVVVVASAVAVAVAEAPLTPVHPSRRTDGSDG
jgi:hypothetical protein